MAPKIDLKSPWQLGPCACCLSQFVAVIGSSVAFLSVFRSSVRSNWRRAPRWQWRDSLAHRDSLKCHWLTCLIVSYPSALTSALSRGEEDRDRITIFFSGNFEIFTDLRLKHTRLVTALCMVEKPYFVYYSFFRPKNNVVTWWGFCCCCGSKLVDVRTCKANFLMVTVNSNAGNIIFQM